MNFKLIHFSLFILFLSTTVWAKKITHWQELCPINELNQELEQTKTCPASDISLDPINKSAELSDLIDVTDVLEYQSFFKFITQEIEEYIQNKNRDFENMFKVIENDSGLRDFYKPYLEKIRGPTLARQEKNLTNEHIEISKECRHDAAQLLVSEKYRDLFKVDESITDELQRLITRDLQIGQLASLLCTPSREGENVSFDPVDMKRKKDLNGFSPRGKMKLELQFGLHNIKEELQKKVDQFSDKNNSKNKIIRHIEKIYELLPDLKNSIEANLKLDLLNQSPVDPKTQSYLIILCHLERFHYREEVKKKTLKILGYVLAGTAAVTSLAIPFVGGFSLLAILGTPSNVILGIQTVQLGLGLGLTYYNQIEKLSQMRQTFFIQRLAKNILYYHDFELELMQEYIKSIKDPEVRKILHRSEVYKEAFNNRNKMKEFSKAGTKDVVNFITTVSISLPTMGFLKRLINLQTQVDPSMSLKEANKILETSKQSWETVADNFGNIGKVDKLLEYDDKLLKAKYSEIVKKVIQVFSKKEVPGL